jgi:hypothetical protein
MCDETRLFASFRSARLISFACVGASVARISPENWRLWPFLRKFGGNYFLT